MRVLFFAALRESIDVDVINVPAAPDMRVADLKRRLSETFGAHHFSRNILCAVNQQTVSDDALLSDGDEVAFYPPVTGG